MIVKANTEEEYMDNRYCFYDLTPKEIEIKIKAHIELYGDNTQLCIYNFFMPGLFKYGVRTLLKAYGKVSKSTQTIGRKEERFSGVISTT